MTAAPLFDPQTLARNRERARRIARPGADFLLRTVEADLALRLSAVGRRLPNALIVDGTGAEDRAILMATGKFDTIRDIALTMPLPGDRMPGNGGAGSADCALSLLNLQAVDDVPGALARIRRLLKRDGLFIGAMLGAGTLSELREALIAAESALSGGASARVIPFADVRDAGALLQRAGFALPVADTESLTVRYGGLSELMADLRAMGATNPLAARSRRPPPRGLFALADAIYRERFSDADGRIRATFNIVWMSGWAPDPSQQKPLAPGSAKHALKDFL